MGRPASHTATQKLGQILGLLVIPILVLWAVYFIQAKRDIDTLSTGLQSVEQAQTSLSNGISNQQLSAILKAVGLAIEDGALNDQIDTNILVQLPQLFQKRDEANSNVPSNSSQLDFFNDEIKATFELLSVQLSAHHAVMLRNLIVLTLAGFISSLVGIGLAVLLMRSTFQQLDSLVHAHGEAQTAKREAEQVALRFTTINNDISNLNQELASKIKAISNAQDELLRKNRIEQLGQLTATIAHEIRNPLGAIRTSAFMLDRRTSKVGLDAGELIERINNSVNRCDAIISQLHDFAQVKEPNNAMIILDDWLSKVVREEAHKLPTSIFVECSLGLNDLRISFDPAQLQRAVVNILNNASEALQNEVSKDGVVKQKHIWVTSLRDGEHAVVRIADNGPGISDENINKICEPLFTTKSFGSGLGLPVVEQIVTVQGGHLNIASNPGGGAKISIYLPIANRTKTFHAA